MQQFIVRTQNEAFDGKLAGVNFTQGKAIINQLTIDKSLAHTVDQVLVMMKDLGHEVFRYDEESGEEVPMFKDQPAQEETSVEVTPKAKGKKK